MSDKIENLEKELREVKKESSTPMEEPDEQSERESELESEGEWASKEDRDRWVDEIIRKYEEEAKREMEEKLEEEEMRKEAAKLMKNGGRQRKASVATKTQSTEKLNLQQTPNHGSKRRDSGKQKQKNQNTQKLLTKEALVATNTKGAERAASVATNK
jgi:hypothetical protein